MCKKFGKLLYLVCFKLRHKRLDQGSIRHLFAALCNTYSSSSHKARISKAYAYMYMCIFLILAKVGEGH